MISVIIPARNEQYLQQTVNSLLEGAEGEVEIIVVLDGYWPNPPLKDDKRVVILHHTIARGMQGSVNEAARIAKGKYLLKNDAHCMWAKGWDTALKANCEENWLVVPPRYSLNVEKWERNDPDRKLAVCYNTITFPYSHDDQFGTGFHGKKMIDNNMGWHSYYGPEIRNKDKIIDDVITIQGSAWFLHKSHFFNIGGQDEVHCSFYQEPQEMTFKTWLSGGRVVVNKNTWYAHWHKTKSSEYGWSKTQKYDTQKFSTWVWMNDKWPKQTRPIKWLIDKFMPMKDWPENWEEVRDEYQKQHPESCTNFRIFNPDGNDGFKGVKYGSN